MDYVDGVRFGGWLGVVLGVGLMLALPPIMQVVKRCLAWGFPKREMLALADAVNRLSGEVRGLAKAQQAGDTRGQKPPAHKATFDKTAQSPRQQVNGEEVAQ